MDSTYCRIWDMYLLLPKQKESSRDEVSKSTGTRYQRPLGKVGLNPTWHSTLKIGKKKFLRIIVE